MKSSKRLKLYPCFLFAWKWKINLEKKPKTTGVPHLTENTFPEVTTVGLYLGSWEGARGGGRFLMGEVFLHTNVLITAELELKRVHD